MLPGEARGGRVTAKRLIICSSSSLNPGRRPASINSAANGGCIGLRLVSPISRTSSRVFHSIKKMGGINLHCACLRGKTRMIDQLLWRLGVLATTRDVFLQGKRRQAVEVWLRENGFLAVLQPKKCCPFIQRKWSQMMVGAALIRSDRYESRRRYHCGWRVSRSCQKGDE